MVPLPLTPASSGNPPSNSSPKNIPQTQDLIRITVSAATFSVQPGSPEPGATVTAMAMSSPLPGARPSRAVSSFALGSKPSISSPLNKQGGRRRAPRTGSRATGPWRSSSAAEGGRGFSLRFKRFAVAVAVPQLTSSPMDYSNLISARATLGAGGKEKRRENSWLCKRRLGSSVAAIPTGLAWHGPFPALSH